MSGVFGYISTSPEAGSLSKETKKRKIGHWIPGVDSEISFQSIELLLLVFLRNRSIVNTTAK